MPDDTYGCTVFVVFIDGHKYTEILKKRNQILVKFSINTKIEMKMKMKM